MACTRTRSLGIKPSFMEMEKAHSGLDKESAYGVLFIVMAVEVNHCAKLGATKKMLTFS